jgi:signal transduction histidine kinase
MRLRAHLTTLVVATLLPMVAFGVLAAALIADRERDMFERAARERALASLFAIDGEVAGYVSALDTLARSPALFDGYLRSDSDAAQARAFREEAKRTWNVQRLWAAILLTDRDGRVLLELPEMDRPPRLGEKESLHPVLRTREPVVSDVFDLDGVPAIAVQVPVVVGGRVTHVLSARVRTRAIELLLEPHGLTNGGIVAVFDGAGTLVAHSRADEANAATLRGLAVAELPADGWHRIGRPGGERDYVTVASSQTHGWRVALFVPAELVEAVGSETRWLLLLGLAVAALGAVLLARWLSSRIAQPILSVAAMVERLPSGVPSLPPDASRVAEIHDVGCALIDAARAVRERSDELIAADRAKDEFLAMLGHELRNPLGAMASAAQLLELAPPADGHDCAARDVIARQVRHMTRLIDDLLDVGRVTRGKVKLELRLLDLASCVRMVLRDMETGGRLGAHQVEVDLASAWVRADGARIEQIVTNLVVNAEKYTPSGGKIRISVAPHGGRARLVVEDSGVGLAPELVPKVFDLFVQGERSIDRSSGGLGIGLTLVKGLTELHGGEVFAESDGQDKGSRFTVLLPLVPTPAGTPAVDSDPAAALPRRPAKRTRRVLVVEDNEDARRSLTAALHLRGHEVAQAADGAEGLRVAQEAEPEVALIDIGLPEIDGLELARRLRRASARSMRLVAMSGYSEQEMGARAREAGFDA